MDCLALSITDGLVYSDLTRKKSFFIAGVFALGQGLFPLIGFLLGETIYRQISDYDHWVAFGLLALIGGKMIFDGAKGLLASDVGNREKLFSVPSVIVQGIADSIDAFAVGIAIRSSIDASADWQIYLSFAIIAACTFAISLIGLFAGSKINKLLKGKYEIGEIIGGLVLLAIAMKIVLEAYLG